jgi:signal transduction histidine kinase
MVKPISFKVSIALGFHAVISLMIGIVIVGFYNFRHIEREASRVETIYLPDALLAEQMALNTLQVQRLLTLASINQNPEDYKDAESAAQDFKIGILKFRERLSKDHLVEETTNANESDNFNQEITLDNVTEYHAKMKELTALEEGFEWYYNVGKQMSVVYQSEGLTAGNLLMEDFNRLAKNLRTQLNRVKNQAVNDAKNNVHTIIDSTQQTPRTMFAISLAGILLGLGIAYFLTRYLSKQLGIDPYLAKAIALGIAEGNLNQDLKVAKNDTGSLLYAMQHMQQQLLARLTANQELLEETARLKLALENISVDGIVNWNPQTDQVVFSSRWYEIIGYPEHESTNTGRAWLENLHPDDKELVLATVRDYFVGDQSMFTVEFRIRTSETPWKWILARGKLVKRDSSGKPLQVIAKLTDISGSKAMQTQLVQAQKLEAIGQLAAGVAHEINTPIQYIGDNLSALNGNFADIIAYQKALVALADQSLMPQVEALADKFDLDFILEDSPKAIKQAQEGVERVAEIVKAMKTFSHVEQSQSKQTVNLHESLNSALTISRNSYKYIAEVETDFSPEVGFIDCYSGELNQVFLNLIINAAHAIEENKAGIGRIKIVTQKLDDSVEILIQDNGAGIPLNIQEKVFNLFFTTKEVGKGTGQGLSLAYSVIVEKHGGKLFFESSPGLGTTFHIQLPLKHEIEA